MGLLVEALPADQATHEAKERAFSAATRREILDRDEWQCQACGDSGENKLQLHHVQYRSQGGAGVAENGVTVCADCHRDIHEGWLSPLLAEWAPGRFSWFWRRRRKPRRWRAKRNDG